MTASLPLALAQADLPYWVELLSSIATIVIALALILIAVALLIAALAARKLFGQLQGRVDRVLQENVQPILRHAQEVADNVNYVSTAVRADVEQLKSTVDGAQARITSAAEMAEQRIHQFNALLKVVQDEAEDIFIGTVSTLRGVQVGTRVMRGDPGDAAWQDDGLEELKLAGPTRPPRHHS